jgi:hypothetical protein
LLVLNFTKGADMKKLFILLAAMLTFTSTAFAQIGSLSSDTVFTPVTPCRIMDTRNAGSNSGILLAGTTRTFFGNSSSSNYPSQGSSNANCGIPFVNDVAAVVLNFTTVTPAAAGFITVFPADAAQPTAATVNFTAGSVVGNNATLKLDQGTADGKFTNVHVVGDVVGYYSKPVSLGSFACTLVTAGHSLPINFAGFQFNTASCPATHPVVVSSYCWNQNNPDVYGTGSGPNGGWCGWRNLSGVVASVTQGNNCCRVPGR